MEAYSQVYETPEVLNEEIVEEDIEVLDEATMSDFDAGGGGAALRKLVPSRPGSSPRDPRRQDAIRQINARGRDALLRAGGGEEAMRRANARLSPRSGLRLTANQVIERGRSAAANKLAAAPAKPKMPGLPPSAAQPGTGPTGNKVGSKPTTPAAPTSGVKPTTSPAPKPGNTTTPKPTKPEGSAMDQFRKANPKLAAAADEKARIRGTSQTDNPLMKDMRSKMSMTPSVQSPTLAKDLGGGSGNQSLINNPNASKAAPPKPAAAAPKPKAGGPVMGPREKALNLSFDLFDLVKGHLLDEGYADTEESAMVIMVNMSEAWRESILESHGVELDEAQRARENPEEYERSESSRQSKRERAMNDPHTGINSPAFAEFMRQQMGGKKKKS